jgi:hypothetical protein
MTRWKAVLYINPLFVLDRSLAESKSTYLEADGVQYLCDKIYQKSPDVYIANKIWKQAPKGREEWSRCKG